MSLNATRVTLIRTSGLTDMHWSRIWRVHVKTIRDARVGRTWGDVPTPPDTASRACRGSWGDLHDNGEVPRG
jgi:hypothetical protein